MSRFSDLICQWSRPERFTVHRCRWHRSWACIWHSSREGLGFRAEPFTHIISSETLTAVNNRNRLCVTHEHSIAHRSLAMCPELHNQEAARWPSYKWPFSNSSLGVPYKVQGQRKLKESFSAPKKLKSTDFSYQSWFLHWFIHLLRILITGHAEYKDRSCAQDGAFPVAIRATPLA